MPTGPFRRSILIGLWGLAAMPAIADDKPAVPPDLPKMVLAKKTFDRSLLAPVDGVTYEQYGEASYLQFVDPDADKKAVLARLRLTTEQFEAANKAFGARMKQDRTDTMIALFGAYFNEVAVGPYAAWGRDAALSVLDDAPLKEKAPMPEAKFREIQVYYGRKAIVAGTALDKQDDVLKPYNLSFNDFNVIGAWFGRRSALQANFPEGTFDRGPPNEAVDNPKTHPEYGGLWRVSWNLLKRGDAGMIVDHQSRDVCLKAGMDAATLPLMPTPKDAKCVLVGGVDFYESGVGIRAQCDHGAYGSSWGLTLSEPIEKGKSYKGDITFNMENERVANLPDPMTPVTAQRLGPCP